MDQVVELASNYSYILVGIASYISLQYLKEQFKDKPKMAVKAKLVPGSPTEGPYRHVDNLGGLIETRYKDFRTVDKIFADTAATYPNNPCLGTRTMISEEDVKQPDGKVFKKATYGEYTWRTFKEVSEEVNLAGNGLGALGLTPKTKVAIFLETRAEWMITIQACFKMNFPAVTIYATLGEDGIKHALNQTEVTHIVTSSTLIKSRLQNCVKDVPHLTNIIFVKEPNVNFDNEKIPDTIKLTTFNELIDLGNPSSDAVQGLEKLAPTKDDLAIIMYTSGTSGNPKGVLISHGNFVAGMSGIGQRVTDLNPSDVYIGYLPLAHVLELAAENIILMAGARVGYSSPLTLSDKSSRIKPGTKGDATVLRPTLMACVPEIMERMRKAVMQNIKEQSSTMQKVFNWAYNYKLKCVEQGTDTPILNKLIFKKTRALLGGRVRAMLSGGAPCDGQTQRFMNVCMCCPVGQGYGLTETCGATTVTEVDEDFTCGRVGPPLQCCDIKLVAWEEGGYSPDQNPPRGEIHIGGPNITMGYFKNPEKTAEDFYVDEDGKRWFKTGDIGQIEHDGCLRIVDRKKDLVKLSHGEYLALGSIESKLKTSDLIDNIWIFASSSQPFCLAFIVPNEKTVKQVLGKSESDDWEKLCESKEVETLLVKSVQATAKTTNVQKFEIPRKIFVEAKPWVPEDNLITAAFKLKRKALEGKYKDEIDRLYAK